LAQAGAPKNTDTSVVGVAQIRGDFCQDVGAMASQGSAALLADWRVTSLAGPRAALGVRIAREVDWNLSLEASAILTIRNIDSGVERFPALLYLPKKDQSSDVRPEDIAKFYLQG
jgi:hypothetical protein